MNVYIILSRRGHGNLLALVSKRCNHASLTRFPRETTWRWVAIVSLQGMRVAAKWLCQLVASIYGLHLSVIAITHADHACTPIVIQNDNTSACTTNIVCIAVCMPIGTMHLSWACACLLIVDVLAVMRSAIMTDLLLNIEIVVPMCDPGHL